jgi:uncharacterized membrane protein
MGIATVVQIGIIVLVLGLAAVGLACNLVGKALTWWRLRCEERRAEQLDFWKYRLSRLERSWNAPQFAVELEAARRETSLFSPSLEEVQAELDSAEWESSHAR